jgi:hypothetical protein
MVWLFRRGDNLLNLLPRREEALLRFDSAG